MGRFCVFVFFHSFDKKENRATQLSPHILRQDFVLRVRQRVT